MPAPNTAEPGPDGAPRMRAVTRALDGLLTACGYLSAVLIVVVLAIVGYAIVQRYVLGSPLLWGDELLGYALVTIVMLGAADALRHDDHIAMDVLSSRAGPRLRRALEVWASAAVLAFSVVLGWSTWESIRFAMDFGSYAIGYIELATWIPQVPMLLGSVLLGLTAAMRALRAITTDAAP